MIIFNEHKYAVEMNNNPTFRKYTFPELVVYTKWLRQMIFSKYDDIQVKDIIKNTLIGFCTECWEGFDKDVEYKKINSVIASSLKFKLRSCNPIYISKNEWENLLKLKDKNTQKIYFVCLVVAKFNRFNKIQTYQEQKEVEYEDNRLRIKIPDKDIYKYANIKIKNKQDHFDYWAELSDLNLIKIQLSNTIYRIIETADIDIKEEDIFIKVSDFDNMILYYEKQFDNTIKECPCGDVFKDKTENQRLSLCPKCKKEKSNQRVVICEDCGKRFNVDIKNTKTTRCNSCQKVLNSKNNIERINKCRNKN